MLASPAAAPALATSLATPRVDDCRPRLKELTRFDPPIWEGSFSDPDHPIPNTCHEWNIPPFALKSLSHLKMSTIAKHERVVSSVLSSLCIDCINMYQLWINLFQNRSECFSHL